MAFIDLTDAAPGVPVRAAIPATAVPYVGAELSSLELSSLELRVVELARDDGLKSLEPPRKRSRLGRLILGPPPPSKFLANERLEALRRLAVRVWHHGYTVPASALREARDAGFSDSAIGAVIDMVGRSRVPFQRIST
jgi:hypothetical protein